VPDPTRILLPAREYNLAATLNSGQTFRWRSGEEGWEGIVGDRWVRLRAVREGIAAETAAPQTDWTWLERYLQTRVELPRILATFPADEPICAAIEACRGLRLLRQDPWECLASFICSSTKQIVQIAQIISRLCARFGEPVAVPAGQTPAFAFPSARRIAALAEADLRACQMGFRAPHLLAAAHRVARGELSLDRLQRLDTPSARAGLMTLPGVGPKIADCVLLFAYGRQDAFPLDVWVTRALCELYFSGRRVPPARLREFGQQHFGPFAGYAQQYLFHYIRIHRRGPTGQNRGRT